MSRFVKWRGVIGFGFRFLIIAPFCLTAWWLILPVYVWGIGQLSGGILVNVFGMQIDAMRVATDSVGVLNTRTTLAYYVDDTRRLIQIAYAVNNIPPFVILVLATAGIDMRQRFRALAMGIGVLVTLHIVFIVVTYRFAGFVSEQPEIPEALGKFMLTLPFVLWIALAYWQKIVAVFEEKK